MHFAFTVTEETFDEVVKKFVASEYRTRGPIDRQEPFKGRALFIFDPSGNRLEAFGGYTAYQMDPDCRAIKWTTDQMGPAVFYYSQELNESFLKVYT